MEIEFIFNDLTAKEEIKTEDFFEIKLLKGADGKDGINGTNGTNGRDGVDGYTPVRGTDYWTSQDIAVIEQYCANYIDQNINQAIGGSY